MQPHPDELDPLSDFVVGAVRDLASLVAIVLFVCAVCWWADKLS